METENSAAENLNEVVDIEAVAPVEQKAEPQSEPVKGRDAAAAAFDKFVADSERKTAEKSETAKATEAQTTTEAKNEGSEEAGEDKEAPVVKGLDPSKRGPNSWKAPVREKFQSLPAEVQAEVLRRENEHQKLMSETTDLRRFGHEFSQVVGPYEAFMRSHNVTPLAAVKDMLNTAYTLKTGDPTTKATLIAAMIRNNNIDIGTLDTILAGQTPKVDPHTAAMQRELAELKAQVTQSHSATQAQSAQAIDHQIEAFANDPANEFFHDVVADMQVLLANGRATDLKDAYDKACRLNPDVTTVLNQRSNAQTQAAAGATTAQAVNVQQKVAASSSVKGAPATTRPTTPKPKLSGRDAALAAWERLEKTNRS